MTAQTKFSCIYVCICMCVYKQPSKAESVQKKKYLFTESAGFFVLPKTTHNSRMKAREENRARLFVCHRRFFYELKKVCLFNLESEVYMERKEWGSLSAVGTHIKREVDLRPQPSCLQLKKASSSRSCCCSRVKAPTKCEENKL